MAGASDCRRDGESKDRWGRNRGVTRLRCGSSTPPSFKDLPPPRDASAPQPTCTEKQNHPRRKPTGLFELPPRDLLPLPTGRAPPAAAVARIDLAPVAADDVRELAG